MVLLGCPREPAEPVIATFAGGDVRQSDLDTWRSFLNPKSAGDGGRIGLDSLERHVVMRTLAAEAIADGLEEEPAVRLRIRRAIDERLANALHEDVSESVAVPEEEIAEYLRQHRDELEKPERRTVSVIFRRAAAEDRDEVRAELETVRERCLAGEEFATLAGEASDSPTRFQGGRLGTVREGQLPEALDRALFALEEGGVSEVVETGAGLALLRADRILPAYTMEAAEARRRVETYLRRPYFEEVWRALVAELTAGRIHHDPAALSDPATPPDAVVSRFGEETLTRAQALLLVAPDPDDEETPRQRDADAVQALDHFATNALLAVEARRRGLHRRPERERELGWVRLEQLSRAMLHRRVDGMMPAPDEEMLRRSYDERREAYRLPDRHLLHVLRRTYPPDAPGAVYRELAAIVEAARGGAASLAAAAGEDAAATWYTHREVAAWGPTLLRAVTELQPGEVTEPIQENGELWVVQLVARDRGRLRSFEEVRDEVASAFERSHRRRLIQQVLQWTLADAALERRPNADEAAANETGGG